MKRFLAGFLLFSFLILVAKAGDITGGVTFTPGMTVTDGVLNNAFGNATINATFLTGKTTVTPADADLFLISQGGSLRASTFAVMRTTLFSTGGFTQSTTISGVLTPSQVTSNQDNYNPAGLSTATTLRVSTDASRNFTGLAGGASGRIILWHNVGSFNEVLKDEVTSTAGNRFALTHDITVPPDGMAMLHYDSTTSRWRSLESHYHVVGDLTDYATNINPAYTALSDAATITVACSASKVSQNFYVTLGGNRTLAFSGATNGMQGILYVLQDGTGNRTLTLPVGSKVVGGGAGAVTLSTSAGSIDILAWTYDGTNFYFSLGRNWN